jgi:TatA/E family protein of Tat protein translocase
LFDWLNVTAQIEGIEWVVVLIIIGALLIFGPKAFPAISRALGRTRGEFRRGQLEVDKEIQTDFPQQPQQK